GPGRQRHRAAGGCGLCGAMARRWPAPPGAGGDPYRRRHGRPHGGGGLMIEAMTIEQLRREVDQATAIAPATTEIAHPTLIAPPEFSDDALALAFVDRAGDDFRWSPGLGWMVDDGIVWQRDERLLRYDMARRICREAANHADEDDGRRLASAKTVNATLALAQTDQRLVLPADAWDRDPMMLNTPGGIVDLS